MTDTPKTPQRTDEDEIDLLALLGTLWDGRWRIAALTLAFTMIGIIYALLATPVYRATSLVQVEEKSGLPARHGGSLQPAGLLVDRHDGNPAY